MEVIDIIVILNKGMLEQMVNSNMVALCVQWVMLTSCTFEKRCEKGDCFLCEYLGEE